jgi:coenzyme F420 hydrogenase subunit beta
LTDDKSYAFIGKPCEIEGLNEMQKYLPELQKKIKLRISLMCAGTPSRKGTRNLLRKLRVDPSKVKALSYRGNGWPGYFTAKMKDGSEVCLPYQDAWNHYLSKYSCVRCILCDNPLGSGADITVGDAWDPKYLPNCSGLSAVIVNTKTGRKYMNMAIENHVVSAEEVSDEDIRRFQKSLLRKTEKLSGNIFAYRFVFLGRLDLRFLHRKPGALKAYYSLFKRVMRFFTYKISTKYY